MKHFLHIPPVPKEWEAIVGRVEVEKHTSRCEMFGKIRKSCSIEAAAKTLRPAKSHHTSE
jgi:hypothetical protein